MPASDLPTIRGPWSRAQIAAFLDQTVIPMRIGVDTGTGAPLVLSVWFLAEGPELLGATRPTSTLVRCLERQPLCGFEIAADTLPYRGVRGRATVELDHQTGSATLDRLLIRYLGGISNPLGDRLRAHAEDEVCLRLRPVSMKSWDFGSRMETSLPTATER